MSQRLAAVRSLHPLALGLEHKHVGSLHAADARMAIEHARDVYTRRQEGVSIWVVRSADIIASDPERGGGAVRAGARQGLPPSDLLRDSRRGEEPVSALPSRGTATRDAAHEVGALPLRAAARRHLAGARRSASREWVGHAPALEEDLGLANLALDLIGQARLLLAYAGELEGRGRDEDALAFLRDAPEFPNLTLAEQPNGDFGHTIVRQWLLDGWQLEIYQALASFGGHAPRGDRGQGREGDALSLSLQQRLAGAPRRRHRREPAPRAAARSRSCGASPRSCSRPMRSMSARARRASRRRSPELAVRWSARIDADLRAATLQRPAAQPYPGTASAACTPSISATCSPEMQHLQRTYPGARW